MKREPRVSNSFLVTDTYAVQLEEAVFRDGALQGDVVQQWDVRSGTAAKDAGDYLATTHDDPDEIAHRLGWNRVRPAHLRVGVPALTIDHVRVRSPLRVRRSVKTVAKVTGVVALVVVAVALVSLSFHGPME